jgi:hypothetical protein
VLGNPSAEHLNIQQVTKKRTSNITVRKQLTEETRKKQTPGAVMVASGRVINSNNLRKRTHIPVPSAHTVHILS